MPTDRQSAPNFRLAEIIMALSLAADIGTCVPMESMLSSCTLSASLGRAPELGEQELTDIYYLALLCFSGCTADAHESALLFGDETALAEDFFKVDFGQSSQAIGRPLRHVGVGKPPLVHFRMFATISKTMARGAATQSANVDIVRQAGDSPRFDVRLL